MTFEYTDCEKLTPSASNTSLTFAQIPSSKYNYRLKASDPHASVSAPQYAFVNRSDDSSVPIEQRQQCFIQFDVPYDIDPTVFLYYKLTKFYQNHRRYVKSLDMNQLKGQATKTKGGDCKPLDVIGNLTVYPCGLIANSLFNGSSLSMHTFIFAYFSPDSFVNLTSPTDSLLSYNFTSTGIAWPGEAKKYAVQPGYSIDQITPPPNWALRFPNGYTNSTPPPDLKHDEHFQNWMRTAGLPTFTKLFGRNDHDKLLQGRYQIVVNLSMSTSSVR